MNENSNDKWVAIGLTVAVLTALHKRKRAKKNSLHNSEFTNPTVQGVNREETHAMLCGFATEQDARRYVAQPRCSSYLRDINGGWKFRLFENVDAAFEFKARCSCASMSSPIAGERGRNSNPLFKRDISRGSVYDQSNHVLASHEDIDDSQESVFAEGPAMEEVDQREGLTTVRVPGNWQLQVPGDSPIYTNFKYIIPVDPPLVPEKHNPTGYYRHRIKIPQTWSSRKIILSFGGVDSCFYCWVNNQYIGFSKDSRLPADFDITAALRTATFGETAVLECIVIRYSDGTYLEDQDMWNLSGIFRDVHLLSLPLEVHIADINWSSSLNYSTMISSLAVGVQLDWNRAMVEKLILPGCKSSRSVHETDNLRDLQRSWMVRYQLYSEGLLVRSMQTRTGHNFVFDDCSADDDPVTKNSDFATVPEELIPGHSRNSDLLTAVLPSTILHGYGAHAVKKNKASSGVSVPIGKEATAAAEAAAARAGSATTTRLRTSSDTGAPEPTPHGQNARAAKLHALNRGVNNAEAPQSSSDRGDSDANNLDNNGGKNAMKGSSLYAGVWDRLNWLRGALLSDSAEEATGSPIDALLKSSSSGSSFSSRSVSSYHNTELFLHAPNLWSAERPYVYTLVVSLVNALNGEVVQSESCRVGFRSVDITGGLLRVNHSPLTVRGVNIHEHDPMRGHMVSPQLLEADVKLMKRNNFNAVRTSHYPQCPWFYELCNVYGLYVVDECNIETHGMMPYAGRLADDPLWEKAYMQRLIRMYMRDRTNPCIISWSLGNEAGYGQTHDKMYAWIKERDPSRLVMYEPASYGLRPTGSGGSESSEASLWGMSWWYQLLSAGTDGTKALHIPGKNNALADSKAAQRAAAAAAMGAISATSGVSAQAADSAIAAAAAAQARMATDLLCPMYSRIEDAVKLANVYPDLPLVLSEYSHMMGNSGGSLSAYWEAFKQYPRLQGGFIWDWVDQGIAVTDSQNRLKWAYGGDFGELAHDANFCLNGLCWPHRGLAWPLLPGNLRKVTISVNTAAPDLVALSGVTPQTRSALKNTTSDDATPFSPRSLGDGFGKINVKQSLYWNKYFAEHTYTGGALIERARKDAASMMRAYSMYDDSYSGSGAGAFTSVDSLNNLRKYSTSQHSQGDSTHNNEPISPMRDRHSNSIRSLDSLTMWSPSSSTTNYLITPANRHPSSTSLISLNMHSNHGEDSKKDKFEATATLSTGGSSTGSLGGGGTPRSRERRNSLGSDPGDTMEEDLVHYQQQRKLRSTASVCQYGAPYGLSGAGHHHTWGTSYAKGEKDGTEEGLSRAVSVEGATSKPQLLEAKYCQQCFDCEATAITLVDSSGALDISTHDSDDLSPRTLNADNVSMGGWTLEEGGTRSSSPLDPMAAYVGTDSFPSTSAEATAHTVSLQATVRYQLTNLFDHVSDIEDELAFYSMLVCDGLIVAVSKLRTVGSGFLHSNHNAGVASTETNYEASTQQLECEGKFSLRFHHIGKGQPLSRTTTAVSPRATTSHARSTSKSRRHEQQQHEASLSKNLYSGPRAGTLMHMLAVPPVLTEDVKPAFSSTPPPHTSSPRQQAVKSPSRRKRDESLALGHMAMIGLPIAEGLLVGEAALEEITSALEALPEQLLSQEVGEEDYGLEPFSLPPHPHRHKLHKDDIHSDCNHHHWTTAFSAPSLLAPKWSNIVLGVTARETAWAAKGYPMGFRQDAGMFSKRFEQALLAFAVREPRFFADYSNAMDSSSSCGKKEGANEGMTSERDKDGDLGMGDEKGHVSVTWQRRPLSSAVSPRARDAASSDIALRFYAPPPRNTPSRRSSIPCPPGALPASPDPTIQVVVSSSTGMLQGIQIAGVDLLAAPDVLAAAGLAPSRIQLHRAQTDNDKGGYGRLWKAGGLDREMEYLQVSNWCDGFHTARGSGKSGSRGGGSSSGSEVVGSSYLEKVVVKRVRGKLLAGRGWQVEVESSRTLDQERQGGNHVQPRNDDSSSSSEDGFSSSDDDQGERQFSMQASLKELEDRSKAKKSRRSKRKTLNRPTKTSPSAIPSAPGGGVAQQSGALPTSNIAPAQSTFEQDVIKEAQGVQCEWKMRPTYANKSQLRIARKILGFHEDASISNGIILVRNREEEEYVHHLAASLLLGKASIRRRQKFTRKPVSTALSSHALPPRPVSRESEQSSTLTSEIKESSDDEGKSRATYATGTPVASRTRKRLNTPVKLESAPLLRVSSVDSLGGDSESEDRGRGGESIPVVTSSSTATANSTTSRSKPTYAYYVRLWKLPYYQESTTQAAEAAKGCAGSGGGVPRLLAPKEDVAGPPATREQQQAQEAVELEPVPEVTLQLTYLLSTQDGTLMVQGNAECSELHTGPPRVGLQLQLGKNAFNSVSWLGAGPHECYPDRLRSTVHGVHRAPILSLGTPYVVPGENGSRANVSWLELGTDCVSKLHGVEREETDSDVASVRSRGGTDIGSEHFAATASSTTADKKKEKEKSSSSEEVSSGGGETIRNRSEASGQSEKGPGVDTEDTEETKPVVGGGQVEPVLGTVVYRGDEVDRNNAERKSLVGVDDVSPFGVDDVSPFGVDDVSPFLDNLETASQLAVPKLRRTATPFVPITRDLETSGGSYSDSPSERQDGFGHDELSGEKALEVERQELLALIEGALSPAKIRLEGCPRFHFGVQEHTTEDLSNAHHSTDLDSLPRPFLSLNLDPFLMGVGGDDSWTASVHDEHILGPDKYSFEFSFSFLST